MEWPFYGGDQAGSKYSPLTEINAGNVSRLHMAWQWQTGEVPLDEYGSRPGMFEATPLMIDNVLYLSTPYHRVVALDAETGAQIWAYDPKSLRGRPAAKRHRLRASRRRRVARRRRTADLPQHAATG